MFGIKDLFTAAALGGLTLATGGTATAAWWTAGLSLASGGLANREQAKAKKAAARATRSQLEAQREVIATATMPRQTIYGQAVVGGPVVFGGESGGYVWLVIAHADHQCSSIARIEFGDRYIGQLKPTGFSGPTMYAHAVFPAGSTSFTVVTNTGTYTSGTITGLRTALVSAGYVGGIASGLEVSFANTGDWGADMPLIYAAYGNTGDAVVRHHNYVADVTAWFRSGSADQPALQDLITAFPTEWTSDHRGRGICHTVLKIKKDKDIWINGFELPKFYINGKNTIFDPRDTQNKWSENSALIAADILKTRLGVTNIDNTQLIAAANVCDEIISGTYPRYSFNGVITADTRPFDAIDAVRDTMAGDVFAPVGAAWKIVPGHERNPLWTLIEDDFVGGYSYDPAPSRDTLINSVVGQFISPDHFWQSVSFPEVVNSAYLALDGAVKKTATINYPHTIRRQQAQTLAMIAIHESRNGGLFSAALSPRHFQLIPTDVVQITHPFFGWVLKHFEIIEISRNQDLTVSIIAREWASDIYNPYIGTALPVFTADTSFANPQIIAAPAGVSVQSGTDQLIYLNGTIQPRARVSWTQSNNPYVTGGGRVLVRYRTTGAPDWVLLPALDGGAVEVYLDQVEAGQIIDVAVQFQSRFFGVSDLSQVSAHTVVGKTAAPNNVTGFVVQQDADGGRKLSWNAVNDIDVINGGGYLIRYFAGSTSNWASMTALHEGILVASPYETNQLLAGTYTFAIRAVDSSGNLSSAATFISATLGDPRTAGKLQDIAYHAGVVGWQGTRTNCVAEMPAGATTWSLRPTGNIPWSSIGAWSGWNPWNKAPASTFVWESPEVVLSTVGNISFTPKISYTATSVTVQPQVRVRSGTTWGSWANYTEASLTGNAVQIRLNASSVTTSSVITTCRLVIDGQPIREQIEDSDTSTWPSTAVGKIVPISRAYAAITQINVTLQNVGPGWSYDVKNKSVASPTIEIYDANGSAANALVDVEIYGIPLA